MAITITSPSADNTNITVAFGSCGMSPTNETLKLSGKVNNTDVSVKKPIKVIPRTFKVKKVYGHDIPDEIVTVYYSGTPEDSNVDVLSYQNLSGYKQTGWVGEGNAPVTVISNVTSDRTIYAVWKENFSKVEPSGNKLYEGDSITLGLSGEVPSDLVWKIDEGAGICTINPTLNNTNCEVSFSGSGKVVISASWGKLTHRFELDVYPICTVTFDTNNSEESFELKVKHGNSLGTKFPASPTKNGFTFNKWIFGSEEFRSDTVITSDITVVADWVDDISAGDVKDISAVAHSSVNNVRSVTVHWNNDEEEGTPLDFTKVSCYDVTGGLILSKNIKKAESKEASFDGLSDETQYKFGLIAVDEAGNASNEVFIVVPAYSISTSLNGEFISTDNISVGQYNLGLDGSSDDVNIMWTVSDSSYVSLSGNRLTGQARYDMPENTSVTVRALYKNIIFEKALKVVKPFTFTLSDNILKGEADNGVISIKKNHDIENDSLLVKSGDTDIIEILGGNNGYHSGKSVSYSVPKSEIGHTGNTDITVSINGYEESKVISTRFEPLSKAMYATDFGTAYVYISTYKGYANNINVSVNNGIAVIAGLSVAGFGRYSLSNLVFTVQKNENGQIVTDDFVVPVEISPTGKITVNNGNALEHNNYWVIYDLKGADLPGTSSNAYRPEGGIVTQPQDPVKLGYVFRGWYADAEYKMPYEFGHTLDRNVVIYAKFDVGFNLYADEAMTNEITVDRNTNITQGEITVDNGLGSAGGKFIYVVKKPEIQEQIKNSYFEFDWASNGIDNKAFFSESKKNNVAKLCFSENAGVENNTSDKISVRLGKCVVYIKAKYLSTSTTETVNE